eukprot:m.1663996 g.1663996  ORF g.1663996 m.1663996 type:complete len:130 (+) comp137991_c0_seq1:120-509(+)
MRSFLLSLAVMAVVAQTIQAVCISYYAGNGDCSGTAALADFCMSNDECKPYGGASFKATCNAAGAWNYTTYLSADCSGSGTTFGNNASGCLDIGLGSASINVDCSSSAFAAQSSFGIIVALVAYVVSAI